MRTKTLQLYSLNYSQVRTYLMGTAFALGNLILPQLCHMVPQGGLTLLPIYFFTLVGAYKYGWRVGLLTAVLSPVLNHMLFGMPPLPVLPAILVKSVLLVLAASFAAHYFKRISIPILALVIISYQIAGSLFEYAMTGDCYKAVQDFTIGLPGMLLQIAGGYMVIKYLIRK